MVDLPNDPEGYGEEIDRRIEEARRREAMSSDELKQQEALDAKANAERRLLRQNADVFRKIMQHPHGRKMLWDVLSDCHVFNSYYTSGSDPLAVVYAEGKRKVGLDILIKIMTASLDSYMLMWRENSPDLERYMAAGTVTR